MGATTVTDSDMPTMSYGFFCTYRPGLPDLLLPEDYLQQVGQCSESKNDTLCKGDPALSDGKNMHSQISEIGQGKVVLQATILTAIAVFSLTIFTFWAAHRGHDFSFMYPFLFTSLLVLMAYLVIKASVLHIPFHFF
ncbi:hypothetical protein GUJ93_ZPchr0009g688 [Zizania palustris]|uniref:Uncharacterized protein n=1 Tax=Zizania palustris TaxID=103762 RepID=A0A8J5RT13_ZIZPA|nr:hypothetical protein GUJ93_ZPchr0009g688 [Zizania palustris]